MEIIPGSVGDVDTDRNWSQSGQGSINISQGGIIAIAVIVGIVVILGGEWLYHYQMHINSSC